MGIAEWNQATLPKLQLSAPQEVVATTDVLASALTSRVALAGYIIWACFGFTFYGVALLLTRVYSTGDDDGADDDDDDCSFDYGFLLITYTAELVGIFYLLYQIDWLGRAKSQAVSYFVAALDGQNSNKAR